MANAIRPESAHGEAEELLPWYATGQLNSTDRALVESHLSVCDSCQRELKSERLLVEEFRSLTPEIDTSWAQLRAAIEQQRTPRFRFRRSLKGFWIVLSRPAVAALVAAQLAFAIIAGATLLSLNRPGPPYRALGAPDAPRTANVLVIFRPDATEEDIRDALRASEASLVGGPTAADAYLINVPQDRRAASLAKLQSDEDVQMAEPIDGASP